MAEERARTSQRIARALALPIDEYAETIAPRLIDLSWRKHMRDSHPNANPFSPRYKHERSAKAGDIAATAMQTSLSEICRRHTPVTAKDCPELEARLSADTVRITLDGIARRLNDAANDPKINHFPNPTGFVLVHDVTRIAAKFTLPNDKNPFGRIHAKSYEIKESGVLVADDYLGLGVGTRLYEHAADLHPDVRWSAESLSDNARPLRARMHAKYPYTWDAVNCDWCDKQLTGYSPWREASPADFTDHP